MTAQTCPCCQGARLRPEVLACTVQSRSIDQIMRMSVEEARTFFDSLDLSTHEEEMVDDLLREVRQRLTFLANVGLGYLRLNRKSGTLSGGEAQRIRLATQIGSGLVGVLYVLDEPSIGLHQKDNERLIRTLRDLQGKGNTVVVVEHDEQMIRLSDYVIDLGPGAGRHGGELLFAGPPGKLASASESSTARYLSGQSEISVPVQRKKP